MVVSHKTTKTYAVQGDVRRNGRHVRTVRVKIDRVDRIGLREARQRARELMSQIQSGIDPTSKPDETGITVRQALEIHLSERTFRPSTEGSYRYILDHQLARFRGRAVADLTRADVRELFEEMKIKRGTTTAGGAMRVLRALINIALNTPPAAQCALNPVSLRMSESEWAFVGISGGDATTRTERMHHCGPVSFRLKNQ